MLRNAGVNVTEHKIIEEVQKAYEYDYFHECSRRAWRRDQDVRYAGHRTNMRRQPRNYYSYMPRHLPTYCQSARSSISSYGRYSELDGERIYGVKRIYLPERDIGESSYFIRKPCYREKYYSSNSKPYQYDDVERPLRRDFRFNPDRPKRTSSLCVNENGMERLIDATRCLIDNYRPKRDFDKYKKPIKTITKKLSPIFTCDCTAPFCVNPPKRTYIAKLDCSDPSNDKAKSNNLSKEAKKLSQDIFNLLSLLQKTEIDDEEQYSSDSVLQQVHNFDCSSTKNVTRRKTDLITEHVQIYPKIKSKEKIHDPLTTLKNITGVRSKLEQLVSILKQYENKSNSKAEIVQKNENLLSPGVQSFQSKDKVIISCNDETKGYRKDIVLQTEEPKTSNKSISSRLKKNSSTEVMRLLKSRFSTKVKEKTNTKKRKAIYRKKVKEDEGRNILNIKKTSIDKIRENEASDQNLTNESREIKTGLMITIGGKVLRKKQTVPEKRLNKMSNTWIRKYLDTKPKKATKDIYQRWNNRAFYNHSSTTVVEVINNVYKQMGINLNSKYKDASRAPHNSSKKSSRKTKNPQPIEAYMMPQMVMHPVCTSKDIISKNHVTIIEKLKEKLPSQKNININNDCFVYPNILNSSNDLSSIFFRIYVAKDFFNSDSSRNKALLTSEDRVFNMIENKVTKSNVFNNSFTDNGSRERQKPAIVHKEKDDVHVIYDSFYFLPEYKVAESIVYQQVIKNTSKLEYLMQEPVDKENNVHIAEVSRSRVLLTYDQDVKVLNNVPFTYKQSENSESQLIVPHKSTDKEIRNSTVIEKNSGTPEVQLKIKLTSEGKIANVFLTTQENEVNKKLAEQIVNPVIETLKSSVKIHLSVENVGVNEQNENQRHHILENNSSKKDPNTCDIYARRLSDSVKHRSKLTNEHCSSFHKKSDHIYSKWIDPLYDNGIKPSCAVEPKIKMICGKYLTADFKVNTFSSLDHYNIIEEYVMHLLGDKDKMIEDNLNPVVETTCMLDAISIINAHRGLNERLINYYTSPSSR